MLEKETEIIEQLNLLLANSNTTEVFDILLNHSHDNDLGLDYKSIDKKEIYLLSSRYKGLLKRQRLGVLSDAEYFLELNKVNLGLAEVIENLRINKKRRGDSEKDRMFFVKIIFTSVLIILALLTLFIIYRGHLAEDSNDPILSSAETTQSAFLDTLSVDPNIEKSIPVKTHKTPLGPKPKKKNNATGNENTKNVENKIPTIAINSIEKKAGVISKDYSSGERYIGEFNEKGKRHGKGTYYYGADVIVDSFFGNWNNGNKTEGTLVYRDGDKYVGQFNEKSNFEGQGTYSFADGSAISFSGKWKDNKKVQGLLIYRDGDQYEGQFNSSGERHGKGKYTYKSSQHIYFDGEWINNNRIKGTMLYSNGDKYIGEFNSSGERHGIGKYFYKEGNSKFFDGTWTNNNREKGKIEFRDGDTENFNAKF